MDKDWYRNTDWNEEIAARFELKLGRARKKEQYLRIQACTLATRRPLVALHLLDRYFEMPDQFDRAQALVDRATALQTIGRYDEAAVALESALEHEALHPYCLTQACLDLPYMVATSPLPDRYDRALEILDRSRDRPTFPVERFRWAASRALIKANQGKEQEAKEAALIALEAASEESSGFRYHKLLGLVRGEYRPIIKKMKALARD